MSICIPSYNNADHIEETLQSVFDQTYSPIELIITDDGSTDDTPNIIKRLASKGKFKATIKLNQTNNGIEANWNQAMELATGAYIKLLPADDVLASHCIETQVALLEKCPDLVLAFSARSVVTKSGKPLLTARFYDDQVLQSRSLIKRCILSGTNVIGEPGAVLFRSSIATKTGKFDGSKPYVIDLDYWVRLLKRGDAVASYATLCTFRIDGNLSVRLGWDRLKQYLAMIDVMKNEFNVHGSLVLFGKARATLNELLRRVVHFVFKMMG